jgi:GntR family phosphonate transport system transcriptional regulator
MRLYRQISAMLEEELRRHYRPGMQLPAEPVLSQRFMVNRHTLRHAIDELVSAGLVERRRGRGVFVLDRAVDYGITSATRFTETLMASGNTTESVVIRKQIVPAEGGVAQWLEVAQGTRVIWIETLRKVNDRPFCLISHYLPYQPCHLIFSDYERGSLHQFIQDYLGRTLERRSSLISTQLPQSDDASLLGIPQHQPVLRVKSLNVDAAASEPIEYSITRFRGDRVQLEVKL